MITMGRASPLTPTGRAVAPGLVGAKGRRRAPVWMVWAAFGACCPPPQIITFGSECPEVLYTPTGEEVSDPEECPPDTCPFWCGFEVCPDEYANPRGVWCEPCADVQAYREGDGAGCVWSWDGGSMRVYCGASK